TADHRPDGSLGLLELFLSLLRPLESFPCAPILWRAVDSCSSSRLLSDRRLFRVAFSHGVAWFHLLEQRRGSRSEGAGWVARYRDVRDADCRTLVRSISGGTLGVCDRVAWLAWAAGMVSRPRVGDWLHLRGKLGPSTVFRLLLIPLWPPGLLYAHASRRVGSLPRMLSSRLTVL